MKFNIQTYFRKTLFVTIFFAVFSIFYAIVNLFLKPLSLNADSWKNNNSSFFGLNIPANLTFCGEQILDGNYEAWQSLEKEFFSSSHWKKNYNLLYQRACRWFPYIEPILKEEGLPDDVKYIAVIESHLTNTFSKAGAAGFWQLLPKTAASYGLEVNDYVDERLDVEKSTRAASKVLKEAYARLGTWVLATAAYNRGIGGIENAMKEQKAESFYDLRLNPQSQEFIYRVLAYKTLLSYPKHFDISFKPIKHYPKIPVKIVTLDTSMNYPENIARLTKSSVSVIMKINPWIVGNKLPNPERKEYKIKIPKFPERDYTPYYVELRPGYTDTPGSIRENKDSVVKPLLGEEMGSKFKQKAKK